MNQEAEVIRSDSKISYSYATIRLTQSRIDKGLIALPIALAKWFPDHNAHIQVYLGDSAIAQPKRYSCGSGSTKECRIGGVSQWFEDNGLTSGDEIVVQVVDKENSIYRLIAERRFLAATQELQSSFDNATDEQEATEKLVRLAEWTHTQKDGVVLNEYRRLVATSAPVGRRSPRRRESRFRERTPAHLRRLLAQLYRGRCQVCDFGFLKRTNEPYFEIHHLDATAGHHPKNLVVVCGNCHNQFEHADVEPEFNDQQWLIRVRFNRIAYQVKQLVLTTPMLGSYKELYV